MPVRTASARWNGSLTEGQGTVALGSGAFEGQYSFSSRFEEGAGTNPEELIGAAHAGCFSMALSAGLAGGGHTPDYVETTAKVHIDKDDSGFSITTIELTTRASIPGIDDAAFQKAAEAAKTGCPVSKALAVVDITLDAQLV
ncbi:MAG: OsmC family protein [Acidimicrobiales bacterium]